MWYSLIWLASAGVAGRADEAMAAGAPVPHRWPDSLDTAVTVLFVALVISVPALGYFFLICDVRAYLRRLRRALVAASNRWGGIPGWARPYTPPSIAALGLTMPCTETQLLEAYRERVKQLHPDLGGDARRFLRLQTHFENALTYLRMQQAAGSPTDLDEPPQA